MEKLDPMDKLDALIAAGWGEIPQEQIPADWYQYSERQRKRWKAQRDLEAAMSRRIGEDKRKRERQAARDRWHRTKQPAEVRRRTYLAETGRTEGAC